MHTVVKIIKKISNRIEPDFEKNLPSVSKAQESSDGTLKLLLEFNDGIKVESVIMPFYKRHTVCLSTQAGCAMGCRFCATGMQGFVRNLTSLEIVAQYLVCYQYLIDKKKQKNIPKPGIVFMGEGEPLHNFDNVKSACNILTSRDGVYLGPRQITLSTAGYLPGLERIEELGEINLALSLHSAIPEKRRELIPLENKYGLNCIIPLLEKKKLKKKQFINFEYLLISGFNNNEEDAEELYNCINKCKSIVNIIPYNQVHGVNWKAPTDEEISSFKEMLVKKNINTMVRASKGTDIEAACGQLKGSESY